MITQKAKAIVSSPPLFPSLPKALHRNLHQTTPPLPSDDNVAHRKLSALTYLYFATAPSCSALAHSLRACLLPVRPLCRITLRPSPGLFFFATSSMTRQSPGRVSHAVNSSNGSLSINGPRATSPNSASPEPEPEKDLIDLSSDDDVSQLGKELSAKATISGASDHLGLEADRNSDGQSDNSPHSNSDSRLEHVPRPRNNLRKHPSHAGIPVKESKAGDIRLNPNGLRACFGLTELNELCRRDGVNVLLASGLNEYYCHQHDPRNADLTCHAINKGNKKQCARTCSYPTEIRAGRRPVCNQHFEMRARLIAR